MTTCNLFRARVNYTLPTLCHNFFSHSPMPASLTVSPPTSFQTAWFFCRHAGTRHPHVKTETFAHRSLSYCAPKQYNILLCNIRHIQSSHAFRNIVNDSPQQTIPQQQLSNSVFFCHHLIPVTFLLCALVCVWVRVCVSVVGCGWGGGYACVRTARLRGRMSVI